MSAGLLHYRLTRRGVEITSEVICQRHYEEAAAQAGCMSELSQREVQAGQRQTVTAYTGAQKCATCEAYGRHR